jgi:hypothetical protein
MPCKYFLYAHPNSYVFTLKQDGESWLKEFSSIFDAVAYADTLPHSENATVTVYDAAGARLVELRVHDEALATV